VYPTNSIFPKQDVLPLKLTPDQAERLQKATAALPPANSEREQIAIDFRKSLLHRIIYFQGRVIISDDVDTTTLATLMEQIRDTLYKLHLPEFAEYIKIALLQTKKDQKHPVALTCCPTAPKRDISSQDISMLGYGDDLLNSPTVRWLILLAKVLPATGNDYGGVLSNLVNLNLHLLCPGALGFSHVERLPEQKEDTAGERC
jgi:hypothetical protein